MLPLPVYSYIGLGLSLASCEPGSRDRTQPLTTLNCLVWIFYLTFGKGCLPHVRWVVKGIVLIYFSAASALEVPCVKYSRAWTNRLLWDSSSTHPRSNCSMCLPLGTSHTTAPGNPESPQKRREEKKQSSWPQKATRILLSTASDHLVAFNLHKTSHTTKQRDLS